MVYESGFSTRRTYTRPVVSSYSVSIPIVQRVTRVYKTSLPIYSTYTTPKRYITGARIITSPVRVVTSPTRIVRVIRSTSPSPERYTTSAYSYTTPTTTYYSSSYLPTTYCSSALTPISYAYRSPSYISAPISSVYTRSSVSPVRITPSYLKRTLPGYGARALTNYLNTEPFTTFTEETNRIRHRAQSLLRDIYTPVPSRSLSCTPFPICSYEPTSELGLDAYVSRVLNPMRHVANDVHNMTLYPDVPRKYIGKSHLASVRICGDRAYDIRRPLYDSDVVRSNINILSRYLKVPKKDCIDESLAKEVEAVAIEA